MPTERGGLLSVQRYDVRVDLRDPGAPSSTTRVVFDGRREGVSFLDAGDARVPVDVAVGTQVREYVRALAYGSAGSGLCRVVDEADGRVYVYAASGPAGARRWFTCFDQPDLKAATSVRVQTPPGWVVAGTGACDGAVPTYATGFVAGPFAVESVRGVELYAVRSRASVLRGAAGELAQVAAGVVAEIGRRLGQPGPGRLRVAFVPGLAWPALETAGCLLVRDSLLTAPGTAGFARLVSVLAHEIAHLWFGNLVTVGRWDDLWLQEALADVVGEAALRAIPAGRPHTGTGAARVPSPPVLAGHHPPAPPALAAATSAHYAAGVRRVHGWIRAHGEREWWTRLRRAVAAGPLLDATLLAPAEEPAAADPWDELQRAVAAREADGPAALDALLTLLRREPDADRLAAMATWYTEILRRVGWPRQAGGREADRRLADALRQVIAGAPHGSRLAAKATHAWLATAPAPPVRVLLAAVPPTATLAWAARNRLAALGELGRRAVLAAGTGPEAAVCLAHLPDATEKDRAWDRLFEAPHDPATLAATAAGLWHADHAAYATGPAIRFRHEFAARTAAYPEQRAAVLARYAFPRSVLTPDALTRANELLEADRLRPALQATLADCTADLAWAIRFRSPPDLYSYTL
ncbi:hypothetical protein SRB5_44700 [Streptomyces sp. RB5]|uniref:Aminopeptidase N n=1 Tax=Streptomyces smaragdinus TaxID=2585196 RepID=A0A7K0CLE5_9ACTN|nr:M1 family aminopeptidase [Streptomyces smaragdinus]MQY14306.1 hypothetical protein [Streptomyces smaragdinus]